MFWVECLAHGVHRHVFRQDTVLDKTGHTILRILVKLSWHIPGFPIYSNGTKPGTLHNDAVLRKAGLTAPPPLDPAPNGVVRSIGNTPSHQAALQARYEELTRTGATDIRINQQQVNMQGQHVGYNRPDLQFTQNGQRFTEEWDRVSSNRGELHRIRTEANDPTVTVILHQFD